MQKKLFPIFVAILTIGLLFGWLQSCILDLSASGNIDTVLKNMVEAAQKARSADPYARDEIKSEFLDGLWDTKAAVYGDPNANFVGAASDIFDFLAESDYTFDGTSIIRNRERTAALVELRLKSGDKLQKFHVLLTNTRDRYNDSRWIPTQLMPEERGYQSAVMENLLPAAGFAAHRVTGEAQAPSIPGGAVEALTSDIVPDAVAAKALIRTAALRDKLIVERGGTATWQGVMTAEERDALIAEMPTAMGGRVPWMRFVYELYLMSQWQTALSAENPTGTREAFDKLYEDIFGRAEAVGETTGDVPGYLNRVIDVVEKLRDDYCTPLGKLMAAVSIEFKNLEEKAGVLQAAIATATDAEAKALAEARLQTVREHQLALLKSYYMAEARVIAALGAEGIGVRVRPNPAGPGMGALTQQVEAGPHPLAAFADPYLKMSRVFAEARHFHTGKYKDYLACAIRVRFLVDRKQSYESEASSPVASAQMRMATIFSAVNTTLTGLAGQRDAVHEVHSGIVKSGNVNMWVRNQRYSLISGAYSNEANTLRTRPEGLLQNSMNGIGAQMATGANAANPEAFDGGWDDITDALAVPERDAKMRAIFDAVMEGYRRATVDYEKTLAEQFANHKTTSVFEMPLSADWASLTAEQKAARKTAFNAEVKAVAEAALAKLDEEFRARLVFEDVNGDAKLTVTGIIRYPMFREMLAASDSPIWEGKVRDLAKETDDLQPRFFDWFGFAGYQGKVVDVVVVAVPVQTPNGPVMQWRPVELGDVYSGAAKPWAQAARDARTAAIEAEPHIDTILKAAEALAEFQAKQGLVASFKDLEAAVAKSAGVVDAVAPVLDTVEKTFSALGNRQSEQGTAPLTQAQADAIRQHVDSVREALGTDGVAGMPGVEAATTAANVLRENLTAHLDALQAGNADAAKFSATDAAAGLSAVRAALVDALVAEASAIVGGLGQLASGAPDDFAKDVPDSLVAIAEKHGRYPAAANRLAVAQSRVAGIEQQLAAQKQQRLELIALRTNAREKWAAIANTQPEQITAERVPATDAERQFAEQLAQIETALVSADQAIAAHEAQLTDWQGFARAAQADVDADAATAGKALAAYFADVRGIVKAFGEKVVAPIQLEPAVKAYFAALGESVKTFDAHFASRVETFEARIGEFAANVPLYRWALKQPATEATLNRLGAIQGECAAIAGYYHKLVHRDPEAAEKSELAWYEEKLATRNGLGNAAADDFANCWPHTLRRLAILKSLVPAATSAVTAEAGRWAKLDETIAAFDAGTGTARDVLNALATQMGIQLALPAMAGEPVRGGDGAGTPDAELLAAVEARLAKFRGEIEGLRNFISHTANVASPKLLEALGKNVSIDAVGKTYRQALDAAATAAGLTWALYGGQLHVGVPGEAAADVVIPADLAGKLDAMDFSELEQRIAAAAGDGQKLVEIEREMRGHTDAILNATNPPQFRERAMALRASAADALVAYYGLIAKLSPADTAIPTLPEAAVTELTAAQRARNWRAQYDAYMQGLANRAKAAPQPAAQQ